LDAAKTSNCGKPLTDDNDPEPDDDAGDWLNSRDRARVARAYRELAPAVLGYLRASRVEDPEDVLGEVFVQVVRDIKRFRGDDAALRRWVFSVAHNRAMDTHRRRTRRPLVFADPPSESAVIAPVEPFDAELLAALDRFTPDQREVVVLRFVADLSLDDVARLTGRTVGAVKALQHRGLAALELALAPQEQPARWNSGVSVPTVRRNAMDQRYMSTKHAAVFLRPWACGTSV
jgi:RNA polymerase sigma factor (sigma-70 family)